MSDFKDYTPDDRQEEIRRQAAEWIMREDRGLTAEEQDALSIWLAKGSRHREVYKKRLQLWKRTMQSRRALITPPVEEASETAPAPVRKVLRNVFAPLAAVACVALGLFMWIMVAGKRDSAASSLQLAATEYERHVLEDGSLVELNQGTRISVEFTADERRIRQHAGEAHFTVAKDADRPFLVYAGNSVIRAVGTAFNVDLRDDSLEVLVTEGRVQLLDVYQEETSPSDPEPDPVIVELNEGERSLVPVELDGATPEPELVSTVDIEKRLEWKSPLIPFSEQPLSKVVAEFNRYNEVQLVLDDEVLGTRTITATLRMNNMEGFVHLLEGRHGHPGRTNRQAGDSASKFQSVSPCTLEEPPTCTPGII